MQRKRPFLVFSSPLLLLRGYKNKLLSCLRFFDTGEVQYTWWDALKRHLLFSLVDTRELTLLGLEDRCFQGIFSSLPVCKAILRDIALLSVPVQALFHQNIESFLAF